jgi:hypothetical protein
MRINKSDTKRVILLQNINEIACDELVAKHATLTLCFLIYWSSDRFDTQFYKPKQNYWNILETNRILIRSYSKRAKRLGFWKRSLIVRKKSRKTFLRLWRNACFLSICLRLRTLFLKRVWGNVCHSFWQSLLVDLRFEGKRLARSGSFDPSTYGKRTFGSG